MSAEYKTMSEKRMPEAIDLLPGFAFWQQGCYTFVKNVCLVIQAAGDYSESDVLDFLRSLPLERTYLDNPAWQSDFCCQRLKKAYESVPDAEKEEFKNTVMDYFLYYFPDRDRVAKWMLIDAFIGFMTGIMEAEKKKGVNDEQAPLQ